MNLLILQKRTWPSLAYHQISETWGKGGLWSQRQRGYTGIKILSYSELFRKWNRGWGPCLMNKRQVKVSRKKPFESCTGQSSQMRIFFSLGSYLSHKLAPRRPRLLWNTMQTSVRLLVWYRTWDAWSRTWVSVQPQFWSCLASDRELCICCYANLWCGASFWILIKPDCVSLWCIKVCFKFLI